MFLVARGTAFPEAGGGLGTGCFFHLQRSSGGGKDPLPFGEKWVTPRLSAARFCARQSSDDWPLASRGPAWKVRDSTGEGRGSIAARLASERAGRRRVRLLGPRTGCQGERAGPMRGRVLSRGRAQQRRDQAVRTARRSEPWGLLPLRRLFRRGYLGLRPPMFLTLLGLVPRTPIFPCLTAAKF